MKRDSLLTGRALDLLSHFFWRQASSLHTVDRRQVITRHHEPTLTSRAALGGCLDNVGSNKAVLVTSEGNVVDEGCRRNP
jgi:hypothetical protein